MVRYGLVWSLVLVSVCWLPAPAPARAADKYTDENRPYEFGFTIDGEQHRHEKKDENGLIMGEFGFITADGVYHVTVYATDENGNFKILSMKNLRVKPFPTSPQSRALEFPPSAAKAGPVAQSPAAPPPPSRELQPLPKPSPARSCSGCSIPTSTTQAPKQLTDLAVVSRDNEQFPPYPEQPLNTRGRQFVPGQNQANPPQYGNEQSQPGFPPNNQFDNPAAGPLGGNQGIGGGINQPGQQPSIFNQQSGQFGPQPNQYGQQPGQFGQQPDYPQSGGQQPDYPQSGGQKLSQSGSPNDLPNFEARFSDIGQDQPDKNQVFGGPPTKPTLISAQMQVVDPNTDIYKRGPGEREGLPTGLNKDDMLQLLYTFNYTVGFHGHHEEGYTNGVKKGYYYVTGRNGVRTRIDYVADDQGFHPKISNEVLDLLSDDVPKPETEKDEKYGLKGYEFKWLYYPPGSRR